VTGPDHLQFSRERSKSTAAGGDTLVEVERAHIENVLEEELRSVERAPNTSASRATRSITSQARHPGVSVLECDREARPRMHGT
jgi:hypothetical protein